MSIRRKGPIARRRMAQPMRRVAQDHQPGTVSSKLRRQMGDAIADLFDDVGQDFFSDAVLSVKDVLSNLFEEKLGKLSTTVKEELGRRGLEESARHFHGFMNELTSDLVQYGMEDITNAVESIASTMAAQYGASDEFSEEPGGDLFEVSPDEVEEVEEVPEEEVEPVEEEEQPEEEPAPAEGEEGGAAPAGGESLEDLFGGAAYSPDARRPRARRPRPQRRQVAAQGRVDQERRSRSERLLRRLKSR